MDQAALKQEISNSFGSPCVVIDLDKVEANIAKLQGQCEAAGVANRPHTKTHKSPVLAKMQAICAAHGTLRPAGCPTPHRQGCDSWMRSG